MLYLLSYVFLLRVPSEALPVQVGSNGLLDGKLAPDKHSRLWCEDSKLTLHLARRKNKPHGSTLIRYCWCATETGEVLCPVCVFGKWIEAMPEGSQPFQMLSARSAREGLKRRLVLLEVPKARSFWLHDFKRGHAQDLVERGATLAEILHSGEWKTPAFLAYLDMHKLECGAVVEAHADESSEAESD